MQLLPAVCLILSGASIALSLVRDAPLFFLASCHIWVTLVWRCG
jgi:hypothetical protein